MNRKISVNVALAITIIAMTVTFAITWLLSMYTFDSKVSAVAQLQAQYQKLAEIDTYTRGNYYGDIDDDVLFDQVAVGYMRGLGDRYSTYYTEQEYAELAGIENGTLVNVGIEVVRDADGSYQIVRVYEDSPAARAGVQPFGYITAVNGAEARSFSNLSVLRSALYGEVGTDLTLDCLYNISDTTSVTIRRSNYRAPTVETIVVGPYAYIRISSFGTDTFSDFDYSLRQAQNAGAQGLVFDVRGNAGGVFGDDLYNIIDMLAPLGTVAKSVNKTGTERVLATSDANHVTLPMAVLVSDTTAGPAELFAASIRDMCGGKLVGTTTAGRGTIQRSPYRLQDGSAISVTVAMLYTGKGESFDGVGLVPDDVLEGDSVTELMLLNPQPTSDIQVLRAFEVVRAMVRERGGDDPGPATTGTPAISDTTDSSDISQSGGDAPQPDDSGADAESAPGTGDDSTADDSSPAA
ncbi:peptidase [Ruminococcaceae bacterium OttesenSCG-928-D13]|nr:peptidase [Ruminococcaceae bacterium OttesenSCG-928-D13]